MKPPAKTGQRTPGVRACRQGGFCLLLAGMLAMAGCESRQPVVTMEADGRDVACTAADFDRLTSHVDGPHLEPYGQSEQHRLETDPQALGNGLRFHITLGLYDSVTHTCYIVAARPAHLTRDERLAMRHEHAHRVQDLHGWAAAAPLWASLPPRLLTHPEINDRLRAEGWIK